MNVLMVRAKARRKSRETKARHALARWLDERPTRTQTALAEVLDVEQPLISQWLRGTARPSPKLRAMLEKHCGIPQAYWLDPSELREVEQLRVAS